MTNHTQAVELLRTALTEMVNEKCDYMFRNKLGNPEIEPTTELAREALAATASLEAPSGEVVYQYRQKRGGKWIEGGADSRRDIEGGPAAGCFEFRTLVVAPPASAEPATIAARARERAVVEASDADKLDALRREFDAYKADTSAQIFGWSIDVWRARKQAATQEAMQRDAHEVQVESAGIVAEDRRAPKNLVEGENNDGK